MKKSTLIILNLIIIIFACNTQSNNDNRNDAIDTVSNIEKADTIKKVEENLEKETGSKLLVTNSSGVYLLNADLKKITPIIKGINPVDFKFNKDSSKIYFWHKKDTEYADLHYDYDEYCIYTYSIVNKPEIKLIKRITKSEFIERVKTVTGKDEHAEIWAISNFKITLDENILIEYGYSFKSEVEEYMGDRSPVHFDKFCINSETGKELTDNSGIFQFKSPEDSEKKKRFAAKIVSTDTMLIVYVDDLHAYSLTPVVKSYANQKIVFDISPNASKVLYKVCTDYFEETPFYNLNIVRGDGKKNKKISKHEEPYIWTSSDELLFTEYNSETNNTELMMISGQENQFTKIADDVKLFVVINDSFYEKLRRFSATEIK